MISVYGVWITIAFILLLVPTFSFFNRSFASLSIDIGSASVSLLIALFVQLFQGTEISDSVQAMLIIVALLHCCVIPFVFLLSHAHQNERSLVIGFFSFPVSLFLAQALLYITLAITLSFSALEAYTPSERTLASDILLLLFNNQTVFILYCLAAVLVAISLFRFYVFKKDKAIELSN